MPEPLPVIVIGAGAAGLMAAIHAARRGCSVILLERTADGGRKILISGGGHCNILPSTLDPGRFVSDSPRRLVRALLASWPLDRQRAFFEDDLGLPLELEAETGKLFPVSGRARDVRDGLIRAARAAGAVVRGGCRVQDVLRHSGRWRVMIDGQEPLDGGLVIIATGGLSVPATGSDGFGLELARRLGHTVHTTYPALTPLVAEPPRHGFLAGVSLPVTVTARRGDERAIAHGGFLFTHRGYSGPAVLDVSHLAARSRLEGGEMARILVCWTEAGEDQWHRTLGQRSSRGVLAVVREAIPSRLAERLMEEAGIAPNRQTAQLSRQERTSLVELLVRYQLPWTGDEGYRKAEVTGGGVALSAVDPVTLESRHHPGLFFCGEVLDAFGPIGGYNFAWAWATGRAAGLGAARGWGRA
jgi:predicted Rossmann fold flavoprotein